MSLKNFLKSVSTQLLRYPPPLAAVTFFVLSFLGRRRRPPGLREERPVVPGGHRELRDRLREAQHPRRLHQGVRIRVLDRGGHPHAEEEGQAEEEEEAILIDRRELYSGINA